MRERRPSPALVVSIIALVMATAGTAAAAKVLITSSSQIKNNIVTTSDIKDGTIAGRDIKSGSLDGSQIKAGAIELGKLEGSAREAITGAQTSATEVYRQVGPVDVPAAQSKRVATIAALEPGVYAIFAKTILSVADQDTGLFQQGQNASGTCTLDAAGDKDDARSVIAGPGFNAPTTMNLQITRSLGSPGAIALDCTVGERQWRASNTSIIAIRVAKAPRTSVDG